MTVETALPTGAQAEAGEQAKTDAAAATKPTGQVAGEVAPEVAEGTEKDEPKKAEKTPEEREIARLRRRVDSLTRQKYELRASAPQQTTQERTLQPSDDESVTLSRAELQKMVAEQAQQLAPSISEQKAEIERRSGVVKSLEKEWGKEEFDAKASELEDVFGGLSDAQGRPKPATDAIFDADNPKAVIEYLTDPENADEAERIASLPATRAGRAIALIEAKLKAAPAKPEVSKAPKPLEAIRGQGSADKDPSRMTDAEFAEWRRKQIRNRN